MNLKKLTLIGIFLPMLFTNGKVTVSNSNKQVPINSRISRSNSGQVTYEYECTDRLDYARVGVESTLNYHDWSNKADPKGSRAVYAGRSTGDYKSITLKNSSNSGIVSTSSGGFIKKVTVTFIPESPTEQDGRGIEIYGSSTAYTAASDLYSDSTKGTLLGTVLKPYKSSGKEYTSELTVSGEYNYIGVKSTNFIIEIEPILFSWIETTPSESDIDAVNTFISSHMHPEISPNDPGTGLCKSESWYYEAKEEFNKLSDRQRAIILTSYSDVDIESGYEFTYNLIKERLLSWARNNHGEISNNKLSRINYIVPNIIKTDHIILIAVITSVLTILSFIGYGFYRYKRDHN